MSPYRNFTVSFDPAKEALSLIADRTTQHWCNTRSAEEQQILGFIVQLLCKEVSTRMYIGSRKKWQPAPTENEVSLEMIARRFQNLLAGNFPHETFHVAALGDG